MTTPLDRELIAWTATADRIIGRRISDARVHAQAGRIASAGERLGELGEDLAKLVGQARVAFLRRAAGRVGIACGSESDDVARDHPILGRTPGDLRHIADEAARTLGVAASAGGTAGLKGWEARQREMFAIQVRGHLSDAQMSMANVVELMAREDEEPDHDDGEPAETSEADPEAKAEAGEEDGTGPAGGEGEVEEGVI